MSANAPPTYFYLLRPPLGEEGLKVSDVVQPCTPKLGMMPESIRAKLNKQYWTLFQNPELMRFMFQIGYHAQYRRGPGKGICELQTIEHWEGWSSAKQNSAIKKLERIQVIESVKRKQGQRPQVRLLDSAPISVEEEVEEPGRGYFRVCRGPALNWAIREPEPYALHLLVCGAILSYYEQSADQWRVYFSRLRPDTYPGVKKSGTARRAWERLREVGLVQDISPAQTREKNARYWLPGVTKTQGMLFDDRFFVQPAKKMTKTKGQKQENGNPKTGKRKTGLKYLDNQDFTDVEKSESNHISTETQPKTGSTPSTEIIMESCINGEKINTKQASVEFSLNPDSTEPTCPTHSTRQPEPDRTDPSSSYSNPTDPENQSELINLCSRLNVWNRVGEQDRSHILKLTRKIVENPLDLPEAVAKWRKGGENRCWDPFYATYPTPADYPEVFTRLLEEMADSRWYRPRPGHYLLFRLRCAEPHLTRLIEQEPSWAWMVRNAGREPGPEILELLQLAESNRWPEVQEQLRLLPLEYLTDSVRAVMLDLASKDERQRLTRFAALTLSQPGLPPASGKEIAGFSEMLNGLPKEALDAVLDRCWTLSRVLGLLPEERMRIWNNEEEVDVNAVPDLPQTLFPTPEEFRAWMDTGEPDIDWNGVQICLENVRDLGKYPAEIAWLAKHLSFKDRVELYGYVLEVNETSGPNWKSESTNWRNFFGGEKAEEFVQAYGDQIPALVYWMDEEPHSGLFPVVIAQGKLLLHTEAARRLAMELERHNPLRGDGLEIPSPLMSNHCASPEGPWTDEFKALSAVLNASDRETYLGDLTAACERLAKIRPEALAVFFNVHKGRATEMVEEKWVRIIDGLVAQPEQYARWVELRRRVWDWFAKGGYLGTPILSQSPWLELPQDHPARQLLEFPSPGPSAK